MKAYAPAGRGWSIFADTSICFEVLRCVMSCLSDSDESSQSDTRPDNDDSGGGVIVKTTEMAITTESIELSEREAPSLSESTRGLNRDFGGGDQGGDQGGEIKADGEV